MKKVCRICGEEKDLEEFRLCYNGNDKKKPGAKSLFRRTECRECERKKATEYNLEHRSHILERKKKYRESHKKELSESWKKYYDIHKKELNEKSKKWYSNHPNARKENYARHRDEYRQKQKERLQTDPVFAFRRRQQYRTWVVFKSFGNKKDDSTSKLVGCSPEELYRYLTKTFEINYNCKWNDNHIPDVHIDHIIPISSAKTLEEAKKLFNYKNLQLLKGKDNLIKSDKIPERQGLAIRLSQMRRGKKVK